MFDRRLPAPGARAALRFLFCATLLWPALTGTPGLAQTPAKQEPKRPVQKARLDPDGKMRADSVLTEPTEIALRNPPPGLPIQLVDAYKDVPATLANDLTLHSRAKDDGQGRPVFMATGSVQWESETSPFLTGEFRNIRLQPTAGLPGTRLEFARLESPLPFHGRCWRPRSTGRDAIVLVLADRLIGINVTADTPAASPAAGGSGSSSAVPSCGTDAAAADAAPAASPSAEAVAAPGPLQAGQDVEPPRRLDSVTPVYPPIAKKARVQGNVLVEALIGTDGAVRDAKVVQSVPLLDNAALDAVRQWRFTPTIVDGKPVEVRMTVIVAFRL